MRSRSANLASRGRPCGAASPAAAWPDPSSRRRDLAPGGWCPPPESSISPPLPQAAAAAWSAANGVPSTSMRCITTESFLASATLALRMPARRASRAAQLFSAEPFTGRLRIMCASEAVPRTVQRRAHAGVADLADATCDVGLAGLVLLRRQAKVSSYRFRGAEPPWVVHRRSECQGHDDADTGHRHEQLRSFIQTGLVTQALLQ